MQFLNSEHNKQLALYVKCVFKLIWPGEGVSYYIELQPFRSYRKSADPSTVLGGIGKSVLYILSQLSIIFNEVYNMIFLSSKLTTRQTLLNVTNFLNLPFINYN